MTIDILDGTGSALTSFKAHKCKTFRIASDFVLSQENAIDSAKSTEKFTNINILSFFGQIGDTDRVVFILPTHWVQSLAILERGKAPAFVFGIKPLKIQ